MRILLVDDSALMRRWLNECFANERGVECATARDGADALAKIESFDPDVVTLDVNMPVLDGLSCLSRIMAENPRPVVMLSSLTENGALATFEALELGAVDYIAKPSGTVSRNIREIFPEIRAKVYAAAEAVVRRPKPQRKPAPKARPRAGGRGRTDIQLVLMGSSTGGPRAVGEVLGGLDAGFPAPILLAQHMPKRFTAVFARRLSDSLDLAVEEVTEPKTLEPGTVYIAQGSADVVVAKRGVRLVAKPAPQDPTRTWTPSIDRMVETALNAVPASNLMGVLLTGMGDDGAASMAEILDGGGHTIAESQDTAAVFGMPKELIERGGAGQVAASEKIAAAILKSLNG